MESITLNMSGALKLSGFTPPKGIKTKPSMLGKDAPRKWINVCREVDSANGKPVTTEFLRLYVEDFYSSPEPGPVYIGHADADLPPGVEEPPSRGWVLAMHLSDDNRLWALIEFTDHLHKAIEDGNYGWTSIYGGYEEDDEGNVTDAAFFSIAITSRPAVPGLVPLAATKKAISKTKNDDKPGPVIKRVAKRVY